MYIYIYVCIKISIRRTNCVIDWIEIYTVDNVINLSNNWGLTVKPRKNPPSQQAPLAAPFNLIK